MLYASEHFRLNSVPSEKKLKRCAVAAAEEGRGGGGRGGGGLAQLRHHDMLSSGRGGRGAGGELFKGVELYPLYPSPILRDLSSMLAANRTICQENRKHHLENLCNNSFFQSCRRAESSAVELFLKERTDSILRSV